MSSILAAGIWDLDNSLTKDWKVPRLSEQFRVQFRAEVFNILNHPSFQNPSSTAASPFNANLAAANPAIPTSGVSPNGSVGRINATNSSPRQIQFALKVVF